MGERTMAGKRKKDGKGKVEGPSVGNARARHRYELLERVECGIILLGTEVKSLRDGNGSIDEAYARVRGGELWLLKMHIDEYRAKGYARHEPVRPRKLLAHKRQIEKLQRAVERDGRTLVPVRVYFGERRFAKVEIAVARGKQLHDKRGAEKERTAKRDMERARRR